jgi:hypothetical protein
LISPRLILIVLATGLTAASTSCRGSAPGRACVQEVVVVPVLEPLALDRPNEFAFYTDRFRFTGVTVSVTGSDPDSVAFVIEGVAGRGPGRVTCRFTRDAVGVHCTVHVFRMFDDWPAHFTTVDLESAEVGLNSLDWNGGATVAVSFRIVAAGGRVIHGFAQGIVTANEWSGTRSHAP